MLGHQTADSDARQADRAETRKGATILMGEGKPELRCLITNLSDEGAELALEDGQRVPARFVLHVPHAGMAYRAEVRWREDGRIGVMFASAEPRTRPAPKVVAG